MRQKFTVTFVAACIVSVALVATLALAVYQKTLSAPEYLGADVFKLLFQFFLLLVLGGAISAIYKEFSSERDVVRADQEKRLLKAQAQRESNKSLSRDLIEIYNESKRIRRILRARALKHQGKEKTKGGAPKTLLIIKEYDKLLEELNDVQLSFETQKRLATVDASLTTTIPNMVSNLGSIEEYLNSIVQEYEEKLPTFESEFVDLDELKRLKEYIGPYRDAHDFKKEFKEPMLSTLTALKQTQLEVTV